MYRTQSIIVPPRSFFNSATSFFDGLKKKDGSLGFQPNQTAQTNTPMHPMNLLPRGQNSQSVDFIRKQDPMKISEVKNYASPFSLLAMSIDPRFRSFDNPDDHHRNYIDMRGNEHGISEEGQVRSQREISKHSDSNGPSKGKKEL
jgi:hypothetical protein